MKALTVIPLQADTAELVPLERWQKALDRQPDDVKVVIEANAP